MLCLCLCSDNVNGLLCLENLKRVVLISQTHLHIPPLSFFPHTGRVLGRDADGGPQRAWPLALALASSLAPSLAFSFPASFPLPFSTPFAFAFSSSFALSLAPSFALAVAAPLPLPLALSSPQDRRQQQQG